jgi:AcrR family transcriptional regulator
VPDRSLFRRLIDTGEAGGQRAAASASQRPRMLEAITWAVSEKGYARVSVADVVRMAGVSRRTFYEQFNDKEDCFLAACETGMGLITADILEALGGLPPGDWRTRARVALDTYTSALAADPRFARTFLIDVLGAGPTAVKLRQQAYDRFLEQWKALSALAAEEEPELEPVPDLILRALIGGITELLQHQILTEGAETLADMAPTLAELAERVIEGGGVAARQATG